ncbi:ABC transporter ATP-binding protein [Saccharopolyspora sp. ASAGF58]|uniref:ABC transporter ATP-binding protein n=1 Tax=Saccharopolyspora sp. ASAGF58 TaxID=2719023 RepID=UPI0014401BEB|nr:ATP-binding cassette domain-containing protein [Saccharopolyspora sp. ASAGF58]QIZ38018.1 ATP-binding cassette domain-containing protein [Saccharopolyspora sp. ASAGF58]
MTNASTVLRADRLSAGYGQATVVRDLDLEVGAGEIVALLGRNGAGKTTTLLTLAGAIPPLGGSVTYLGRPLSGALHQRACNGIAFIPETRAIVRKLTVLEHLRLAGVDADRGFGYFPELAKFARRPAGLLSGGEQQMLVLARVLGTDPRLMLIDELSFGLAPLIVRRLLEALRGAVFGGATGVLLVEQHPAAALAVADRGYVMANGGIAITDTSSALHDRLPEIERAYLSGSIHN